MPVDHTYLLASLERGKGGLVIMHTVQQVGLHTLESSQHPKTGCDQLDSRFWSYCQAMPYLQHAHMVEHAIFAVVRGVFHENDSHYAWSPDPSFSLSFLFLRGLARKTTYWPCMCSLTRELNCHCMTGNGRQQVLYCAYTFLVCFTAVQSRMLNQYSADAARGVRLLSPAHARGVRT